jgi:hypothetical protein
LFAGDRLLHPIRQPITKGMSILQRCPGGAEKVLMVVD